jgi:hypothetical protein
MGKVLVKSAMYQYQMGPEGLQRYYTLGGSGGRAQPGEVRGRTKRDRALGLAGAMAGGVLGLAGESRSLGGFAGNIISGAEQGSRFGRGLANLATTRTRQARADMREQRRIDDTKQRAAELEERRAQGKGFNLPVPRRDDDGKLRLRNFDLAQLNPMARVRAHNYGVQQSEREALDRANFSQQTQMAANEQLGRELARQGKDEYKQRMKGRQRDAEPVLQAVENINQERIQPALDLLTGLGIQAPQQQAQAPQGPVQPAAGFNQNDNTVDQQLNAPENRDNQSNSVEAAQAEVSEESQQGGGDEEPPTDNRRLQMLMERMGQQGGEK